jgi:aspartyl protease family protein
MRSRTIWIVVFAVALTALIVLLFWRFPGAVSGTGGVLGLVYLLIWVTVLGSGILLWRDLKPGTALKSIGIWALVFFVLVAGYSFRYEFAALKDRVLGELNPAMSVRSGPRAMSFRAGENGHFYIEAEVNGRPLRFLVDTGASDIVLSRRDAERVGIDLANLRFTNTYATANGTVRGAPVRLARFTLGPLAFRDLPASVNAGEMRGSLLGISFLRLFRSYDVRNGVLTLHY